MASGFLDKLLASKPLASGENKILDLIKKDKVIEYSGRFIEIISGWVNVATELTENTNVR